MDKISMHPVVGRPTLTLPPGIEAFNVCFTAAGKKYRLELAPGAEGECPKGTLMMQDVDLVYITMAKLQEVPGNQLPKFGSIWVERHQRGARSAQPRHVIVLKANDFFIHVGSSHGRRSMIRAAAFPRRYQRAHPADETVRRYLVDKYIHRRDRIRMGLPADQ